MACASTHAPKSAHTPVESMRVTRESMVEAFKYGIGTVIAFAVDLGLLTWLVSGLAVHYILAAAISFVMGGVVLYLLSVRFVFRYRRIADRRVEMSIFIALGAVGLVIQTLVMSAAVNELHVHYLVAKLASAGCTFIVNFALRRSLLFSTLVGPRPAPAGVNADQVTPTGREQQT
jgi:putative flippase GtrA